ncbi:MAG: prepilin-type N-terminal cleavage/methylation domain-containing protein [Bacillati bacterium ANGP1]|uniref:Prepilin-type N-terminal cleavage/methylation domain-containing protein n=1 Tax=Candidatus Segetimicrobium genomatis TaxID=2569760 RepID=A0A537IUJ3_9BACT|nr:MAG: prepilin-type N-terminal cleavage/methylation domain-containing protein [Terrabacteria group bacterium ANGP1]
MLQFFLRRVRNERGFTLIELLIVVAIIAILAAILIPNFLRARAQSQVAATKGNLKNIATALESYFVDNASYPQPPLGNTNLLPNYTRALPVDPCSGTAFGTSPGYTYAVPSNPATDYTLRTNWTVAGTGAPCFAAADPNGSNIQYTPGGGLQNTP